MAVIANVSVGAFDVFLSPPPPKDEKTAAHRVRLIDGDGEVQMKRIVRQRPGRKQWDDQWVVEKV